MSGELSRRHGAELSHEEPEYTKPYETEIHDIEHAMQLVNGLTKLMVEMQRYQADEIRSDTPELIRQLALVQHTLLQERLHAIHPDLHPGTTVTGAPYSHRTEALGYLENITRQLGARDLRTIDTQAE